MDPERPIGSRSDGRDAARVLALVTGVLFVVILA
jgi:hypothetical protein